MFRLNKKVFIALLSSADPWQQNVSLNNESYMIRPYLIDLNSSELFYYPFIICLDTCNESCDVVDGLTTKIYILSKTKDANAKIFNIIGRKNEAKPLVKHVSCDCKCKFGSTICNSDQKWSSDKFHCVSKEYRTCTERL